MQNSVNKIVKDGNGNTLLFVAIIAAAAANVVPTPIDAVYFYRMSQMKRDYEQGKISAKKYEWHLAGEYYLWTSLWYLSIGVILLLMNNSYKNNIKILGGLVAVGVVLGVVQKNIEKDEKLEKQKVPNIINH